MQTNQVNETFSVWHNDGRAQEYKNYDAAVSALKSELPEAHVGHPGDISCGGVRTLAFPDAETAERNDVTRVGAAIHRNN